MPYKVRPGISHVFGALRALFTGSALRILAAAAGLGLAAAQIETERLGQPLLLLLLLAGAAPLGLALPGVAIPVIFGGLVCHHGTTEQAKWAESGGIPQHIRRWGPPVNVSCFQSAAPSTSRLAPDRPLWQFPPAR